MSRAMATASTTPPAVGSAAEQELPGQLVAAFETADVQRLIILMTDNAWLRIPPVPLEYQGPELIGEFFATVANQPLPTRHEGAQSLTPRLFSVIYPSRRPGSPAVSAPAARIHPGCAASFQPAQKSPGRCPAS
jgi:hypothetical protein